MRFDPYDAYLDALAACDDEQYEEGEPTREQAADLSALMAELDAPGCRTRIVVPCPSRRCTR